METTTRDQLAKKVVAELIGTFAVVFIGCGTAMVGERFPGAVPLDAIPVVFGLIVAAMIYSVGHISGAHFNPAVTLAFAVSRHFPRSHLAGYWAAQFIGSVTAVAMLHYLLPPGITYGATMPHVGSSSALGWEIVLSFFLMFVIVSVATDTRAVGTMAGAAIGSVVMLAAFVGGPVTGASMNPARSLGPAIFEGSFTSLWIYFVGPVIGAVSAACLYKWLRCDDASSDSDNKSRKSARGCC